MYRVNYYFDNHGYQFGYYFHSLWAATFKARAIFEEHGFATDVMVASTGEVLVTFDKNETWVDDDLETDIHSLALQELK